MEQAPGSSAWDDAITVSSRGAQHVVPVVAFHADLQSIARVDAGGGRFRVENAAYSMPDFWGRFGGAVDVTGQCLVHISGQDAGRNLCVFVFEVGIQKVAPLNRLRR